jgi:hypothetical protein
MILPNAKRAVVDIRKLRDYCLNPDNPRGRHKALVFVSSLGITADDADFLRGKLLNAAQTEEVRRGELDLYGQRYTIDFEIRTGTGRATIRSGWIILRGKRVPRMTTCYVMKRKQK